MVLKELFRPNLCGIMGYWKDVSYDMSRGMSRKTAERINALRYDKSLSDEERKKEEAKAEAEIKLNSMG